VEKDPGKRKLQEKLMMQKSDTTSLEMEKNMHLGTRKGRKTSPFSWGGDPRFFTRKRKGRERISWYDDSLQKEKIHRERRESDFSPPGKPEDRG